MKIGILINIAIIPSRAFYVVVLDFMLPNPSRAVEK